jgi:hypothetical protein
MCEQLITTHITPTSVMKIMILGRTMLKRHLCVHIEGKRVAFLIWDTTLKINTTI